MAAGVAAPYYMVCYDDLPGGMRREEGMVQERE